MKILTISEPECGSKPTSYMAVLKDAGQDGIRKQLEQGLKTGFTEPIFISPQSLDVAAQKLFRFGYAWLGLVQEYLAEVTDLECEGKIDAEMVLFGLKNGSINISARNNPDGIDEGWVKNTVEDILKEYVK